MDFAYILASDRNYIQYTNALLNSLDYFGNEHPAYLLAYDCDGLENYLSNVKNVFSFPVTVIRMDTENIAPLLEMYEKNTLRLSKNHLIKSLRMRYLVDIGLQFDAVCLLDADMMVVSPNFDKFLLFVADTGRSVGCNEAFKWTIGETYMVDNKPIFDPPQVLHRFHCSVPLFLDMHHWADVFEEYLRIFYTGTHLNPHGQLSDIGDMFSYNIAVHKLGREEDVLPLPSSWFTQVHCDGYLPWSRITGSLEEGMSIIEGREEVYSLHGRLDKHSSWYDYMKPRVHKHLKGFKLSDKVIGDFTGKPLEGICRQVQHVWDVMSTKHKLQVAR